MPIFVPSSLFENICTCEKLSPTVTRSHCQMAPLTEFSRQDLLVTASFSSLGVLINYYTKQL